MALDAALLAKACGQDIHVFTQLCRAELGNVETAAAGATPCLVCCTQEVPLFEETRAAQEGAETPVAYVNIRERAGWSDEGADAVPKIAALIAEAAIDIPPARSTTITSAGRVLVYGTGDLAVEAAKQLAGRLETTVLLSGGGEVLPPAVADLPLFAGTITAIRGHFGGFEITVDGFAAPKPSSRASLAFEAGRNGVELKSDIILDLSGGDPLIEAGEIRDGYFRPDPGNPAAVQKALFEASDLVGEFDKTLYVTFHENLCAHSRSNVTGCTRCLDVCPASAITPAGDHVSIDPHICGGCGACASVCPTGAASYALPPAEVLLLRLRTLLRTYAGAGGADAVLLVHDTRFGDEMIGMMSRFGRGLPARVLPFAVNEVTQVGFDFFTAAVAYGANRVLVLVPPARRDEMAALEAQIEYTEAALAGLGYGTGRIALIDEQDPDQVAALLYDTETMATIAPAAFLPMGAKREITGLALNHLYDNAPEPQDVVALPQGAPFGRVTIDVAGCTLCLACVGSCPTNALRDNPESPMLGFVEAACIQCGLCRNTCPESVIRLEPRLAFGAEARQQIVLKEEEPFACISCGKPFGSRSAIERTIEKLAGHSMFANDPAALERLRMCDDCRVTDQFKAHEPMTGGEVRKPRATEDYLSGAIDDTDEDDDE